MRRTARPEGLPPAPRSALLRRLMMLGLCAAGWFLGLALAGATAGHADERPTARTAADDLLNGLVRTAEDVHGTLPHTLDHTVRRTLRGTVDEVTAIAGDTPRVLGRPGPAVHHSRSPGRPAMRTAPPHRSKPMREARVARPAGDVREAKAGGRAMTRGAPAATQGVPRPLPPPARRAAPLIDQRTPVPYAPAAPASITAGPAASSSNAAGPAFLVPRTSGGPLRPATPTRALRPVCRPRRAPAGDPHQTPD